MIRYLMLLLPMVGMIASPIQAASSVAPKLNARVGSAEKPYSSTGAYKWYDTSKGNGSGTVIDHATVTAQQRGVNLEKPVDSMVIRDSTFIGQRPMANSQFPAGIFAKQGTNLLVERTTIQGWATIVDSKYRQGDCFLTEWPFVGIVLRDVLLTGCTDGGYDGKARDVLLDRVTSSGNKISFRFWYTPVKATSIVSINPTEAHIQLNTRADRAYGMGPSGIIADKITFISKGRQPLFWAGPGSIIAPKECVIDVAPGTPFLKFRDGGKPSNVTATLGKNCTHDAQGYAVNTPVTVAAPRGFDAGEVLVDRDGDGLVKLGAAWARKLKVPTGATVRSTGDTWYEIAK